MTIKNKISTADSKRKRFKLRHPEKYIGDASNIIFRSTWEAYAFNFCDNNPNILRWGSEEITIPYLKPILTNRGVDFKISKYYPDLYVEYKNKNGELIKELIEIKPKKETRLSKARNPATKIYENLTYMVNTAKWEAAKKWCMENDVKFCVVTEETLFKR